MANIEFVSFPYLCAIINRTMPVNKDAMARYRIIDRMLADPNRNYTTQEILKEVSWQCDSAVSLRMIQKDIKALEEEFGKELVRNSGRRGTVKYADQAEPLFYQELTADEEEVLREALKSLGQFEGLDNFTWLDLLKKKLDYKERPGQQPYISFSSNEELQIPEGLLGRLFSAISNKKVIRITYTIFGKEPRQYTVYPYQLKQYNDRWFLLCTPIGDEIFPFKAEFIATFPLDRIAEEFDYIDDEPYLETPVDLKARFDEIIGVTLLQDEDVEDIYFAVNKRSLSYIQTKYIHGTQIELDGESQKMFRSKYPALKDWTFFSIECRPNYELYSKFSSYGDTVVIVEPMRIRDKMKNMMEGGVENYSNLDID